MRGAKGDLDLMFEQLEKLRDLAEQVERSDGDSAGGSDGGERTSALVYDFSIRWGSYVSGRLHRLVLGHSRGDLAADEERRYRELVQELRDALPITERLGLARPVVAQEQPANPG